MNPRDRLALAAIAVQFFVNGAMAASFIARAPQIRDRIGVTVDEYGVLLTVGATAGLIGSVLAGRLIERFSSRGVLQGGALLLLVSLPVIGLTTSPLVWAIAIAVFFLADALVDIAMNLQGSWLSGRRSVPVMNRLHGLWSLGTAAGGLGAVAANWLEVALPIHLLAVTGLLAVTQLFFVNRHVLEQDEDGAAASTDATSATAAVDDRTRVAGATGGLEAGAACESSELVERAAARTRARIALVLVVLAAIFAVIGEVAAGDWATFRLTDDFASAAALGSLAYVAFTLGMTAMRLGGDTLELRLGARRLHRASIGLATLALALATLVPAPSAAIVGFLLAGMGVATFMPKLYDDAARLPGRPGAGLGAMTAGVRIAFLVTPLAVGWLAGTALSVGEAVALFALPAMLGLAIVSGLNDRLLRRVR